jgi:hypothetical protein
MDGNEAALNCAGFISLQKAKDPDFVIKMAQRILGESLKSIHDPEA